MTGVVLTDGTTTLDLRHPESKLYCFRWFDLLGAPPKRGANRVTPGSRGAAKRPRTGGQIRGLLHVKASGDDFDDTQEQLDTLYGLIDGDDVLTVTVHRGSLASVSGDLQVEDPGVPDFITPRAAIVVVDVTLPDGRLT